METMIEFLNKLAKKGIKLSAEEGRLNCYAHKGTLTDDIRDGIIRYKPELIALFMGREEERRRISVDQNGAGADHPRDKCLHQLFTEQVALNSGKTAVVCGDEQLTYQQVHERSQKLALYLQSLGVKPDSVVGLCVERSLDMVVGVLGILQAGGAYVPMDPDYPAERLAYMLQDSQATIVLTQKHLQRKLSALKPADTQVISVDEQWTEIGDRVAELKARKVELQQSVKPHHLAYVIYTSGSTGLPKGVMVEHRSVVNLFFGLKNSVYRGCKTGGLRVSVNGPLTFDTSVKQIIQLLAGHVLDIVPEPVRRDSEALLRFVRDRKIEVFDCTPSQLRLLLEAGLVRETANGSMRRESLQLVLVGGEAIDKTMWTTLAGSGIRFFNVYGPTECTVDATVCAILPEHAPQSIGRPITNTQVYILDEHNHPQPVGVPGELHIAGDGLARGYLNRPELTREKFVANPFTPGTRMYKTGDLAQWLEDGNIQYLGRIDTQVKIRGFRIELGEIEACLNQHPEIQDSAVIAKEQEGNRQLIAFYRAKETTAEQLVQLSNEELRGHLLKTVPDYMVPAAFVSLAAIPLNANGKVDRRELARMEVRIGSDQEYVGPGNDVERQLVEIWAQVLHLAPEKIGVNDNFFELGGHSLLATQVMAKIRSQLNIDLPLTALFECTSIAPIAGLIAKAEKSRIPAIRPVDRTKFERLPLSFAQERLWFINQLEPGSVAYNLPKAVILHGELDIDQLERAINLIIARHENLRTVFPSHEGQVQQVILDKVDFKLERIDLSHDESKQERDNKAREICQTEVARPFDLAGGPLLRGKVIKLAEQEHVLLLNMHHIVSDGWSMGILTKELGSIMEALRQGRSPELAPLPIQYVDYAVWQRKWLEESGMLKQQLAYWQEKLAGAPESLDLATDYSRPSVQSLAGAAHAFTLDAQLTGQLKSLAQHEGATFYMILLAAFKALLYRYTGQNDICVGSPIANRQYGETEDLIGMFVNTLALRSRVNGEDTFVDFLSQVKATCLEAYEHQDTPFEKVVDLVRPQRNLAANPVFQVMVILQNTTMGAHDRRFPRYPLESGTSQFDLTLGLTETPEGLAGLIEYSTALYKPQTIARMAGHFMTLCRAITTTPTAKIRDLDYICDAENHRLLVEYNNTRANYAKDKCLHELFIDQVALSSGKTAVVCGDEELTYQQLYERSQKLALYLQSEGVKPDRVVGLCMERSLDMMVGLLGILQAGGAYVPLDPGYPEDRLAYMLEDSQAAIVLTQEKLQAKVSALMPAGTWLVAMDRQWTEIEDCVAGLKARNVLLEEQVKPKHLAYVIYTSGSTGKPKGVAIEHHSPVTLVQWASEVYSREELAGMLASTSICFDLSVYEIFVTLAKGGKIILVPNALGLIGLSNKTSVTLINTAPSAMEELVRLGAIPDSVRTINLAGEPLSPDLVDKIYSSSAVKKVYDLYGPSEDTTYSTYMLREKNAPATIGRPIANTQIYILDAHNHLQPIGVPGELHIAGDGLARGYMNRPDLTQEKFVANPFAPGERMYKTGDLARWLEDGTIQYLGRMDTQVKIRGFRIELGEIEAQLNQHQEIQGSAVIAQGQGANRQLIAFYRAKETTADHLVQLPYEELRGHLLRRVPEYMVPAAFVSLAAIPLNTSGKVDRRALARMEVKIASSREYVAPRTDAEKQLVEIWAEVLNLAQEKIGINDNFFELGGHSLLATRLMAKIRSQLNIDLPLKTLFERTSVSQLAELIPQMGK
ncbi:MAG: amino acid adenylation domain-containing protein, partial [Acidobacteriia bacterium]|nr:amino acid adenylation domain-containing protein [Terriglobia bacterium]